VNWTHQPPQTPGFYWVWGPYFPCDGAVWCTDVVVFEGLMFATVPQMDYRESVDHPDWEDCAWMGPIEAPAPPQELEVLS
jgi:hypothetical protein